MTKPAALVVTRNFPPLTGGMERLLQNTTIALSSDFDVTLIGPKGCRKHVPETIATIECPSTPVAFLLTSLLKGFRHCWNRRIRFVLAGNGLVAPVAVLLAKISRARSIVYVHGLDLVATRRFYQQLFVPWIRRAHIKIANSRNTRKIAIDKGCSAESVHVLHPGTHLPPIVEDEARTQHRETTYGETGAAVLFVGRIIPRKGLSAFIERSWPEVLKQDPTALLVVVGDSPEAAALTDTEEVAAVRELQRRSSFKESIRFLGVVSDHALEQYYAAADVLVFPILDVPGDVEGFGMVAVEAAAHGTPTVAFASGGVVDAVDDGVSGHLIPPGDYSAFAEKTVQTAHTRRSFQGGCRGHAEKFGWDRHRAQLFDIVPRRTTNAGDQ